jgi:hypothetical protein
MELHLNSPMCLHGVELYERNTLPTLNTGIKKLIFACVIEERLVTRIRLASRNKTTELAYRVSEVITVDNSRVWNFTMFVVLSVKAAV